MREREDDTVREKLEFAAANRKFDDVVAVLVPRSGLLPGPLRVPAFAAMLGAVARRVEVSGRPHSPA
jgi:hypothetical protein